MKKKTTFTSCFRFWLLLTVFLGPTLSGVYSQAIGDVNENGTVDIVDALMIARYYVGLNPPGFNVILADVNGDNKADIIDALLVAQYYVCRGNCYLTPTPRPTDPPAAPGQLV